MTRLVILFSICCVKCLAMSRSELEEFSNFLEVTSQLDLNLKSKGPDDDYDEDTPISDNAWEESGKFEGDLILNERQKRLLIADVAEGLSRNGLQDSTKRWPNNEVIYYIQREHFSSGQVQAIQAGIDDLAQVSCVRFTPYRKGDRDAVVIQGSRRGCFSQVGYQGGYQVLNLSGRHPVGRGCFRHGTVVHELLHALGFYHMQSSPDRDDYIDVVWQNIIKPARHNFRKYNSFAVNDFGVGYDYESVLHYSKKAFSSNGQDTLVPKQPGAEIGQRVGLSQKDIQKLNKMYCDADFNDANNADSDSPPKKSVKTKKKSKNKPFDGHGIGYHQGKTVAIKLEPTIELLHLPTAPKLHAFDYFSNAKQVLPSTLTNPSRDERKIIYITTKPANNEEYYGPTIGNTMGEQKGNIETATLSGNYKTGIQLGNDEKHSEGPTIDQKSLNAEGKEVNSNNGEEFEKITRVEHTHYDPEHIHLTRQNEKYYNPESHLHDFSEEYTAIQPFEYHSHQNRYQQRNDGNKNVPSFLQESYVSVPNNPSRRRYPLFDLNYSYDPYASTAPKLKSYIKHYNTGRSNSAGLVTGNYFPLPKKPVFEGLRNIYNYEQFPSSDHHDK